MFYIDEVLILNFIIDYILLMSLSELLKLNTKKIKLFLSSLLGEIPLTLMILNINNFLLLLANIICSFIMIYISFGYNDIKTLIKNTIYFYILNCFLGGVLLYFKDKWIYKYTIFLIPVFMKIYKFFSYNLKNIFTLKHRVTIYLNNGKILYLNGYMDTGNTLIEPYTNKKVIITNISIDEKYFYVPYTTINSTSLIKCFNPKKVYIDGIGERDDVCIGIMNQRFIGYNCLLNYKLMEEI